MARLELALRAPAEEHDGFGESVGREPAGVPALGEQLEQRRRRAPEAGADLEHVRRGPDARGRRARGDAVVERVVAVVVVEVGRPERELPEERVFAAGFAARDARIDRPRLVDERDRGRIGRVAREDGGTDLVAIEDRWIRRGREALAVRREHAGAREPCEEPAQRRPEPLDESPRREQRIGAGAGAERAGELEVVEEADRGRRHVTFHQLAALVLAWVERLSGESGLREDVVDARIGGRDRRHASIRPPGASATVPSRRMAPSVDRTSTRHRRNWRTRRPSSA